MAEIKFSEVVSNKILPYAKEEAIRLGNDQINTGHLMLGIIKNGKCEAIRVLNFLGVDVIKLGEEIEDIIGSDFESKNNNPAIRKECELALKVSYLQAKELGSQEIGTEHLLLAFLKYGKHCTVSPILKMYGVDYDKVREEIIKQTQPH